MRKLMNICVNILNNFHYILDADLMPYVILLEDHSDSVDMADYINKYSYSFNCEITIVNALPFLLG